MHGQHSFRSAERHLTAMFLGTLSLPLAAGVSGAPLPTPFGIAPVHLGLTALVAAGAYAAWVVRREGWRAAVRVLLFVVEVGILATLFAWIARERANNFFTLEFLYDGVTVLLALHLVGTALRIGSHRAAASEESSNSEGGGWGEQPTAFAGEETRTSTLKRAGGFLRVRARWTSTVSRMREARMLTGGSVGLGRSLFRLGRGRLARRWLASRGPGASAETAATRVADAFVQVIAALMAAAWLCTTIGMMYVAAAAGFIALVLAVVIIPIRVPDALFPHHHVAPRS